MQPRLGNACESEDCRGKLPLRDLWCVWHWAKMLRATLPNWNQNPLLRPTHLNQDFLFGEEKGTIQCWNPNLLLRDCFGFPFRLPSLAVKHSSIRVSLLFRPQKKRSEGRCNMVSSANTCLWISIYFMNNCLFY